MVFPFKRPIAAVLAPLPSSLLFTMSSEMSGTLVLENSSTQTLHILKQHQTRYFNLRCILKILRIVYRYLKVFSPYLLASNALDSRIVSFQKDYHLGKRRAGGFLLMVGRTR